MNGNYYQNPTFPGSSDFNTEDDVILKEETKSLQDYLLNKKVRLYVSFLNNSSWQSKMFEGTIKNITSECIIIDDESANLEYLIRTINIDYLEIKKEH